MLTEILPAQGSVLEIASGTGEHAAFFAARFPGLTWWPSDSDLDLRNSISAWAAESRMPNLRPPITIDVTDPNWPRTMAYSDLVAILNINMIHVAPWLACEGLLAGAASLLGTGGLLYFYGPFRRNGSHTAPSNAAFDASLRARNSAWGVRDLNDVEACAESNGFTLARTVAMPANNFSAVFSRR